MKTSSVEDTQLTCGEVFELPPVKIIQPEPSIESSSEEPSVHFTNPDRNSLPIPGTSPEKRDQTRKEMSQMMIHCYHQILSVSLELRQPCCVERVSDHSIYC